MRFGSAPHGAPIPPSGRSGARRAGFLSIVGLCLGLGWTGAVLAAAAPNDGLVEVRDARCLALVAYAEAAGEGLAGMEAVMRVMWNRVRHPSFGKSACAVALEPGQFQPVTQQPKLREVLADPEAHAMTAAFEGRSVDPGLLRTALALAMAGPSGPDPTGGALFFVNPTIMDADKCPWFAGLRRTGRIGSHVFMTHYRKGDRRGPPALDCANLAAPDPFGLDDALPLPVVKGGKRRLEPYRLELAALKPPRAGARAQELARLLDARRALLVDKGRTTAIVIGRSSDPKAQIARTEQALRRNLERFRFSRGDDGRISVLLVDGAIVSP